MARRSWTTGCGRAHASANAAEASEAPTTTAATRVARRTPLVPQCDAAGVVWLGGIVHERKRPPLIRAAHLATRPAARPQCAQAALRPPAARRAGEAPPLGPRPVAARKFWTTVSSTPRRAEAATRHVGDRGARVNRREVRTHVFPERTSDRFRAALLHRLPPASASPKTPPSPPSIAPNRWPGEGRPPHERRIDINILHGRAPSRHSNRGPARKTALQLVPCVRHALGAWGASSRGAGFRGRLPEIHSRRRCEV